MSMSISQNDLDAKQINDSTAIFFKRFRISAILKTVNAQKSKGSRPVDIVKYLFSLVFRNKSMYMDIMLGKTEASFGKDTIYRFMKNISINWLRFTTLLAAKISNEVIVPATSEDRVNAFIVDDSTFSRACWTPART